MRLEKYTLFEIDGPRMKCQRVSNRNEMTCQNVLFWPLFVAYLIVKISLFITRQTCHASSMNALSNRHHFINSKNVASFILMPVL